MKLHERLAALLKEKNMTQRELAKRACITPSSVSYYLKGERRPTSEALSNIATALGTTSDYLLGRCDDTLNKDSFREVHTIIARNANGFSEDEKRELMMLLLQGK